MTDQRQNPPVVKSYADGIAARNVARDEERKRNPVFPNLGQAAVTHDPRAPQTLAEVAQQQRADAAAGGPPGQRGLSPATVAGLEAVRATQESELAQRRAQEPTPVPAKKPEPAVEGADPAELEDEAFASALENTKRDIIQNDQERRAVAERCVPLDLASGLLTGEFFQLVPIVPEKLEVKFRCLTTFENNAIRLMLFEELENDPVRARIVSELIGFYQTVAATTSINGTVFAAHITTEPGSLRPKFEREVFAEKVRVFMDYPLPLISSLGTHAHWFEQRVRQLFATTEALKNG